MFQATTTASTALPSISALHDGLSAISGRIACSNCALLLTGETGTGKGHLARWIHDHSPRAAAPFVPVNCGAIPDTLIDSHLFGHARGAFSGAANDHLGLVRAAQGGTLLLDEVGELPTSAQMRLLRLLEEREVQPVGHSKPLKVDVRIIAATNGDLSAAVPSGKFRPDLFFRLDVVRMHLKPLRERVREIPGLLAAFNREFAAVYCQAELNFDREALRVLERHDWPGNVRELRTVVERLHVLCGVEGRKITAGDLREFAHLRTRTAGAATTCGPQRLHELRHDVVAEALSACAGNISRAALTLGVHRSTVYRWLADRRMTA